MVIVCILTSCANQKTGFPNEVKVSSTAYDMSDNDLQAVWVVAATPVGNIPRYVYLPQNRTLVHDTVLLAKWDFLPLPANQTFVLDAIEENTQPLEMLVLSEPLEVGKAYQVKPLAIMELSNHLHYKRIVIGLPTDPELRIIETDSFVDFLLDYDAIKNLLQNYYMNHKGVSTYSQINWHNEQFAYSTINQCVDLFRQQ